ncbi:MAG: hypothetical protein AVDCRST_MAG01-01-398, partial [uncultured Rubrobacteraceae bacterium]
GQRAGAGEGPGAGQGGQGAAAGPGGRHTQAGGRAGAARGRGRGRPNLPRRPPHAHPPREPQAEQHSGGSGRRATGPLRPHSPPPGHL